MRKVGLIVGGLLLFSLLAAAESVTDLELSRDNIDEDTKFKIDVEVSVRSSASVEFFIDDKLFSKKNVGSSTDNVDSSVWDPDTRPLTCGPHTAMAVLSRGGREIDQVTQDFEVGNLPNVTWTPEEALVSDDMTFYLTDRSSGGVISSVKLDIYNPKTRKTYKVSTNIEGKATFDPPGYGEYEATISGRDYCGTFKFRAKKSLTVDGPHPVNPVAGEMVKLAVPWGVGVKVVHPNGTLAAATKNEGGGANFTINKSGEYFIVVGELSTEYWGKNISINITDRPTPQVTLSTEKPAVSKALGVTILHGGEPLSGAKVTITGPDNEHDVYTTTASGKITYTPVNVGDYGIVVDKDKYTIVEKIFSAKNKLNIEVTPETPRVGGQVTLVVRNQLGTVLEGVSIMLSDSEVGQTNAGGRYTLTLPEKKSYLITVSKQDMRYWDEILNVTTKDEINVTLSAASISLGESITASIFNAKGEATDAQLTLIDAAGVSTEISGTTVTPTQPGTYTLIISKPGYGSVENTVTVAAKSLDVAYDGTRKSLKLTLSSEGAPVEGVAVRVLSPEPGDYVSDAGGVVEIPAGTGLMQLTVNPGSTDAAYSEQSLNLAVKKDYKILLLLGLIFVIAVVAAAAVVQTNRIITKKHKGLATEPKKKKESFERKGGSSLQQM